MQILNYYSKQIINGLLLFSFVLFGFNASAEGTAQVMPTATNGVGLYSSDAFAVGPYRGCPANQRIRFDIADHTVENLYFGGNFYNRLPVAQRNDVYIRIVNAVGTEVLAPTLFPTTGAGYIPNYAQGSSGPNIGGTNPAGYTPLNFNPTANGDYYIEIYASNDGGLTTAPTNYTIGVFFDLTVGETNGTIYNGRVNCQKWSFITYNPANFTGSINFSFDGDYYGYTEDSTVLRVNFGSGFRPFAYELAMTKYGVNNTGNFLTDRVSIVSTTGTPAFNNGYLVFLSDPDPNVYIRSNLSGAPALTNDIYGCPGQYFIPYFIPDPGDLAIMLDLNGTPGYQAGTADRVFELFDVPAGNGVIVWDGLDGLGVPVAGGSTIGVEATLFRGRTNVPMYDAELNTNGLSVNSIAPATGNRKIYWDDSGLTNVGACPTNTANITGAGVAETPLLSGVFGPTHAWDGAGAGYGVPAPSGGGGSLTGQTCDDFGNVRTINSWFYAFDVGSGLVNKTLPTCDNDNDGILDNIDIDDDNDGILDVVEDGSDALLDADGDLIPNYLDPDFPGFVDSNFDGVNDNFDLDLDGIINSFDSDMDGDGCPDVLEAGFTDQNGDDVLGTAPTIVNGSGQVTGTSVVDGYTTPNAAYNTILDAGTLSGNQNVCAGDNTTFSSTVSGGSWSSSNTGIATINSTTGVITGVSAGTATMTYTVTGPGGCTDTETRTVTVTAPPNSGTLSGNQNICVGDNTTFSSTQGGGTWSTSNAGVATINPTTGVITGVAVGTAIMTYTVTGTGGCPDATATRTVTVTAAPVSGTLSGNQNICVGDNTTFSSTQPGGTWATSDAGIATINPTTGVISGVSAGTATMTYTVAGTGGCPDATATRTVTVTTAPVAGTLSGNQNICLGDNTTFASTQPGGSWSTSDAGVATINPTTGVITSVSAGTATMTYTVTGTGGCPDATATRTVTITAAASATISYAGTPFCTSSTSQTVSQTGTAGGTYSSTAGLTINGSTGEINPSTSTAGTYTVTYSIAATGGCLAFSTTASVTINTCPPTANDDVVATALLEDGANGTVNILTNDTDTDGTPAAPTNGGGQYSVDLDPGTPGIQTTFTDATGTWTYNPATGVVTFDPANDYNGTATITYELCDPQGNCDQADITFTVDPVQDAPSQGNETMGPIAEDETTPTTSPNLTANNIDPDGTTTTVTTVVSTTGGGTTTITGGGATIDYTPAPGFNGVDTVIYTVCDAGTPLPVECVNDTLFVTVDPVNDPPSQGNETLTVNEDDPATTTVDLTANNVDPDGTNTDFNGVVSTTGGGTITDNGDGTVDYTPAPDFNGIDTVIYTVCDNGTPLPAECVNDTLFVTVNPVQDAPSQGNETMGPIAEDETTPTTSPNLTANNIDPDGTTTTVTTVVSTTGGGTTTITGGGTTIDYTPAPGFNGVDTVIYTVCDAGTPLPVECVNDTLFVTVIQ
jgi:uncharacterized protein YjdB